MTYVELFKMVSKPWASVNDIKSIAYCGRDVATYIRNIITKEIKESGKHLPTTKEKIVPMEYVVKYLGLDIEHITEMAQKENEVNHRGVIIWQYIKIKKEARGFSEYISKINLEIRSKYLEVDSKLKEKPKKKNQSF